MTWNGSEESRAITVTVKAEKDGAMAERLRDHSSKRYDGDGEPISRIQTMMEMDIRI